MYGPPDPERDRQSELARHFSGRTADHVPFKKGIPIPFEGIADMTSTQLYIRDFVQGHTAWLTVVIVR
jgi:hypothetical protein